MQVLGMSIRTGVFNTAGSFALTLPHWRSRVLQSSAKLLPTPSMLCPLSEAPPVIVTVEAALETQLVGKGAADKS